MPDNAVVTSSTSLAIKNKHSAMATFDNPSYFTISGQTGMPPSAIGTSETPPGAKNKKFKSWFKLSKRAFRSKVSLNDPAESEPGALASDAEQQHETTNQRATAQCHSDDNNKPTNRPELPDVVYYNFAPVRQAADEAVNDDDVFSEVSASRSTRTLNRRRHSLGSWFRSSLAAVRKNHSTAASTGSVLEASSGASRSVERPSTSSERALLSRHVSASAHCVSYSSSRQEAASPVASQRPSNAPRSAESKANKRPRLPVSIKSTVELRARARYARQEKLMRNDAVAAAATATVTVSASAARSSASASRTARSAQSPHQARHHPAQTASLDRRYTNSTEVLASKSEDAGSGSAPLPAQSRPASERGDENSREDSSSSSNRRRTLAGSASSSSALVGRQQRFAPRSSRTAEDRTYRTSCCGRAAAAVAVSSCRSDRRRASFDSSTSSQLIRRRCPRCRDKVEPINAKKVDVVIIFSRNCVIATQWVAYLTAVLNNIFINEDRPSTRVTSRDVEGLVHCDAQLAPSQGSSPDRNLARCDYQNEAAAELLEAERSASQRAIRKTVETASLQIVLLSKPLLRHIGQHANDPLGQLLHPKRVIGLLLALDESKDITPLHISALYSFAYWPKIAMLDQDMESVAQFRQLATNILSRSQPAATAPSESRPRPVRFKLTPKKLRPGDERVTVLLLETADGIQRTATVHVGTDLVKSAVPVEKLSWLNPYTFSFNVPREFLDRGITVNVQLKVDGTSWGVAELKCQNKLSEIARLLARARSAGSPLDVMCKALNISPTDTDALDSAFAKALEARKVPLSSHFRSVPANEQTDEEFPTLVHFAARFGLRTFLWAVVESCPFAISAINIQNRQGMTAYQLAEGNGHQAIATDLRSIIEVVANDGNIAVPGDLEERHVQDGYVKPIDERNDYDNLPAPKPLTLNKKGTKVIPKLCTPENEYVVPDCVGTGRRPSKDHSKEDNQKTSDMENEYVLNVSSLAGSTESLSERGRAAKVAGEIAKHKRSRSQQKFKHKVESDSATETDAAKSKGLDSRLASPYTSWSSDRSSVASHMSQDSGTHSESADERKGPMRYDYTAPQGTGRGMLNYLVPPPPRPLNAPSAAKSRSCSPKPTARQQPKAHPFETIEFSPPPSQNILGEDLGRILPNEEPLIFEQTSIPMVSVETSRDQAPFTVESDYIVMTPSRTRKPFATGAESDSSMSKADDDDYLRSDEINAPANLKPHSVRRQVLMFEASKVSSPDSEESVPRAARVTTSPKTTFRTRYKPRY